MYRITRESIILDVRAITLSSTFFKFINTKISSELVISALIVLGTPGWYIILDSISSGLSILK